MAERSSRGMEIGANSLETDEGIAFVERKQVIYTCPSGHEFGAAMVTDAEPSVAWECRCDVGDLLRDEPATGDKKPAKPQCTHWDMLLERHIEDELKELLHERLELLRAGKLRLRRHHG